MKCINCGVEVSASFKHAITKNICPACGQNIFDEETLALIDMVKGTLLAEATLRDETAQKLAVALVAQYDISIPKGTIIQPVKTPIVEKEEEIKIAPPSTAAQAAKQQGVITAEEIEASISDVDREKMMEEVVKEKYNLVDTVQASAGFITDNDAPQNNDSIFTEGASKPILEKERQNRLLKQQGAMTGGGSGAFRRSS